MYKRKRRERKMENLKKAIITFECDDWGSCYQDIEHETVIDINDSEFQIEVQCDLCNKWRNEKDIKEIQYI